MADPKKGKGGPDRTLALDVGQERPALHDANPFAKRQPLPKNLRARLKVEAGPKAPSVIPLTEPMTVLGRATPVADVDVGDESASRRHASIEYKDGAFWIADMGSTNGTLLNGKTISKAKLAAGDEIQIGTALLRFELG